MNNKKTLVIASIIILSIFFILNFPIDYLACTVTTTACRFFDIVKDENFQQNDSTEINDSGVELDIAFPEIEVSNLIYLTTPNDESGRIFVATREGIIFYIEKDSNNISLFIDIREKIDQELTGERGLLGFTFDQNYIDNGYFYIYYIDFDGNSVISRFKDNNNIESIFNTELKIFQIDQPYSNHNGGSILIGPDGYLYIALGDGGSGGDPFLNGQNGNTLLAEGLLCSRDNL